MPFPQDGKCPFKGLHWPPIWPLEQKVTAKKFSSLSKLQQLDLIIYFYARESVKTPEKPQPSYIFPLEEFRGYFGKIPESIRRAVLNSNEYKAYAEEHSRPPPPAEMSLLMQPLTAAVTKRAAPDPALHGARAPGALPGAGAHARSCDVAGEALSRGASTVPPPQSQGEPLPPDIALTANGN